MNNMNVDIFKLLVSDKAVETIGEMYRHVDKLKIHFGKQSREYQEALESLTEQIVMLLGHPMAEETTIGYDGPLSLICTAGNRLVFGLVFHGRRRTCTNAICKAYINDDGRVWSPNYRRFPPLNHEHTPSYPLDAPTPGTWSFHS